MSRPHGVKRLAGSVKVYIKYEHRRYVVELLNKPFDADERHRFLFYGDSKFHLLKQQSTCTRDDLMAALRNAGVDIVRAHCFGQKGRCVNDIADMCAKPVPSERSSERLQ